MPTSDSPDRWPPASAGPGRSRPSRTGSRPLASAECSGICTRKPAPRLVHGNHPAPAPAGRRARRTGDRPPDTTSGESSPSARRSAVPPTTKSAPSPAAGHLESRPPAGFMEVVRESRHHGRCGGLCHASSQSRGVEMSQRACGAWSSAAAVRDGSPAPSQWRGQQLDAPEASTWPGRSRPARGPGPPGPGRGPRS